MKHLLILISLLLLSSPVIGNNHKGETLYRWGERFDYKWRGFGDKETHPKYTGDVKNGKPNGLGYLIYHYGEKYVGSWKNGKKNGQGTNTWSDGEKYVGEWKDGKQNGQGTQTLLDGNKYVGSWKNGERWKGTFTLTNGDKYVGEWKDGQMWNGTSYDKDENILYKIVNGKWIKQ